MIARPVWSHAVGEYRRGRLVGFSFGANCSHAAACHVEGIAPRITLMASSSASALAFLYADDRLAAVTAWRARVQSDRRARVQFDRRASARRRARVQADRRGKGLPAAAGRV